MAAEDSSNPLVVFSAALTAQVPSADTTTHTVDHVFDAFRASDSPGCALGVSRNGRKLLPFMPYGLYAKAQESDLDAIVAYLRAIPPLGAGPAPARE